MNIILFDTPEQRKNLLPLTYTRPIAEFRCGIYKIAEKWSERGQQISFLTENYLSAKFKPNYTDNNLYINGAVLYSANIWDEINSLAEGEAIANEQGLPIAINTKKHLSFNFNIDDFWKQAYSLALSDFDEALSKEDIEQNEVRNRKFQQLSVEQELLAKYFNRADSETGTFMTSTDVLVYLKPLGQKLYRNNIGKGLSSLGHQRIKHSKTKVYGYYLEPLPLNSIDATRSFDDVLKQELLKQ